MRYVTVLEMNSGIPDNLEIFPIHEEQLANDVVEKAEARFKQLAVEHGADADDDETMNAYLDMGYYDAPDNHYSVLLIWGYDD